MAQVGPPQMVNDPLVAKAGTRYDPEKGFHDPWVAEHPYRRKMGREIGRGQGRRGQPNTPGFSMGDIAQRRRNYTMGIPDPQRPRDLTGIPEFDKPKIEAAEKAKESPAQAAKREREENETPEEREQRLEERKKRKKERRAERLLQEQMHVAAVLKKPLHFIQV